MKAFISYSHLDAKYLDRLHTHLAMLRREGNFDAWHDNLMLGGDHIDETVLRELEQANLYLPLVSPDFIASGYCFDRELAHAMTLEKQGRLRILPLWLSTAIGSLQTSKI